MKYYLGWKDSEYHLFQADFEPTEKTHGSQFDLVWGPFKTKRGAEFGRRYGMNNPHTQTVADCERIAKEADKPISIHS